MVNVDGEQITAAQVLSCLADLAPSPNSDESASVIPLAWFTWPPAQSVNVFGWASALQRPERSYAETQEQLLVHGLSDVELIPIAEPIFLGADADDAWAFVSEPGIVRGLTAGLKDAQRQAAMDRLHQVVDDSETSDGAVLGSAAWFITATRP